MWVATGQSGQGVGWVTEEAWHPQPLDYAFQMGEFYLNIAVKIKTK